MVKHRQIPMSFKLEVIHYIEEWSCTPHVAYVHFSKTQGDDYNESAYYQWWKKREAIKTIMVSKTQCTGAGCPSMLGHLEEMLYDIVVDMHIKKMKVTRNFICT